MIDEVEAMGRRILRAERGQGTLLVLSGERGTGKTTAMRQIERWMRSMRWSHFSGWAGQPSPRFVSFQGYLDAIGSRSEPDLADRIERSNLLLLDDVGSEVDRFRSGEPTERLRNLLDLRINRFTIISTNVAPADWSTRWDARVEDRMLRNSIVVDLHAVTPWSRQKSW